MKLPKLPFSGRYHTSVQTAFGGLEHAPGGKDGSLYEMENLSARACPLLSPRPGRGTLRTLTQPGGLTALDVPCWVDGTGFYADGVLKGTVSAGEKRFAAMGKSILIFPDKLRYDTETGTLESLESGWSGSSLSFRSGQIYGEDAEANALYAAETDWSDYFRPGDGVTISGCTQHPENNRTAVIREVSGAYLYFYEYTFQLEPEYAYAATAAGLAAGSYHFILSGVSRQFYTDALREGDRLRWDGTQLILDTGDSEELLFFSLGSSGTLLRFQERDTVPYTETGSLSVRREVPALEHICVNENRLWGSVGGAIYASKLGDPGNFNVFDGLSTDSWASDSVDAGDFTACVSYLGYPVFFKEDSIYKVYGDRPANFQWTPSARLGVLRGCEKSLAVAGETLFYLSRAGVAAYTGGIPSVVSAPLGPEKRFSGAVAGSDGLRYYASLYDGEAWSLYVYDTRFRLWHREDGTRALDFAFWDGGLCMLDASGKLLRLDGTQGTAEAPVSWEAVFADRTDGSPNQKGVLRIQLRAELESGSSLTVSVRYDGEGAYQELQTLTAQTKRSCAIPLSVRRCDHWSLKLSGTGECRIYSMAVTRYGGSERE